MTTKLTTTLKHVNTIPHSVNAEAVKQFYEYLKEIGTSENYQNQNLKQITGFANGFDQPHCNIALYSTKKTKIVRTEPYYMHGPNPTEFEFVN